MNYIDVNGTRHVVEEKDHDLSLLRYLRERLGLTGSKCGCNEGQCGTCNVIIDGKVRRACVLKCGKQLGKSIRTIEGISRDGLLHPVQESFLVSGVLQCGYCTPGQIMAVVALLEVNPNPGRADIDKAFNGVLCRCGSYVRVLKAIERAAAIMRGEPWLDEDLNDPDKVIGNSYNMPDAQDKVTGKTKYCADYSFENQVMGKLVFSEHRCAKLLDIDVETCLALPGVRYVQCYKTTPVVIWGPREPDMPIIAKDYVRSMGEVVAIVYADTIEQAEFAAARLKIVYEPLEPLLDPQYAMDPAAPLVHQERADNVATKCRIHKGQVEAALRDAAAVVDDEYFSQRVKNSYLETECVIAVPMPGGVLDMYIGAQYPHGERTAVAEYLGLEESMINVHQPPMGGSFGGKDGHPLPCLLAYAARHLNRPAKLFLARKDSYRFSACRHSSTLKIRLGADANGRLTAMHNSMLLDGGAYKIFSPRVLPQGICYATGPYEIPNLDISGRIMYTNNVSAAAMRGFGSVQTMFAVEVAMDEMARKLKMDPFALRRLNGLRSGSEVASGMILGEGHAYLKTLDAAEKKYYEAFLPLKEKNPAIGLGVASGWRHITGGLGLAEQCAIALELQDNGRIRMTCSCAMMGNETIVGVAQVAAASLGLKYEDFEVVTDMQTALVPLGGGVGATNGIVLWGTAAEGTSKAFAKRVTAEAKRLVGVTAELRGGKIVDAPSGRVFCDLKEFKKRFGPESFVVSEIISLPATYFPPEDCNYSESIPKEKYKTHLTSSYVTAVVALETNPEKRTAKVLKIFAAFDVGTVINLAATQRQGEGGLLMGMGQGLMEEFEVEDGYIKTKNLLQHKIPGMSDTPETEIELVDNYDPAGPMGAKGIGELGALPVQPAIVNAYYDAIGVRIRKLPLLKYI